MYRNFKEDPNSNTNDPTTLLMNSNTNDPTTLLMNSNTNDPATFLMNSNTNDHWQDPVMSLLTG